MCVGNDKNNDHNDCASDTCIHIYQGALILTAGRDQNNKTPIP